MSRDLIAFLALGASLALGAVVEATDVPQLGDSVHVSARSAAPGEAIELWVSSPYPNRPFSVLASSPSRELFEVASGTTGASGDASLSLQLVDEPTLAGVDLRLAIELEPDAGAVVRSREILLEALPVDDAGGSARETAFEIATDLLPQDTPIGLVAELVDLDGDGDADLLLAVGDDPESGPLRVLVNDGTGHFADESALRLPDLGSSTGRALLVADIDLDSDLDVLVLTGVGEPAHILLRNDGEGRFALDESFPEKHAPDARANGGVFADLDGDGAVEILIAYGAPGSHGAEGDLERCELLRNDGTGRFARDAEFLADDLLNPESIHLGAVAGDVDRDGDLDLFVFRSGANGLLLNDGTGRLEYGSAQIPEDTASTYGAAFADVDLDQDLDLVLAGAVFSPLATSLLLNQGGAQGGKLGVFAPGVFPMPGTGQSPVRLGLRVADIDGDGDADIIFAVHELGGGEAPDLYVNQGGLQRGDAGTFLLDSSYPAVAGVYASIATADIDGDGDLDHVLPNTGSTDGSVAAQNLILLSARHAAPNPPLAFRRGDANDDLALDLSDALFVLSHLFLGGTEPPCKRAADVNGSGSLDLSDPIALLQYLFAGGTPPQSPFPGFGDSDEAAELDCRAVRFVAF